MELIRKKSVQMMIVGVALLLLAGALFSLSARAETKSTYTITYSANGGYFFSNYSFSGSRTQVKGAGETITILSYRPSKGAQTFAGWNTEPDGTGDWYFAGDTYSADADLKLYAQYRLSVNVLTPTPEPTVTPTPTVAPPSVDIDGSKVVEGNNQLSSFLKRFKIGKK